MNNGVKEFTLRGLLLGTVITIVFMAANTYLGLKVGLTIASSIPAAVISMSLLRRFKNSNILENNLIQTQASAAGTLTSIIYVLPALLLVGYWVKFQYWETLLISASGGVLGVLFTIPLRRVLVVQSDLPYPEGLAAAEILKAGGDEGNGQGVNFIVSGSILAALLNFFTGGLKLFSDSASFWFRIKDAIFQLPLGFSFALVGAGYLVGIEVATVMLLGNFFNWDVLVPIVTSLNPMSMTDYHDIGAYGTHIWESRVRMMGAGAIGLGAIWKLCELTKPMILNMKKSIAKGSEFAGRLKEETDRDISAWLIGLLFIITVVSLIIIFYTLVEPARLPLFWLSALVIFVVFVSVFVGFLISATCGYMAGLLGTSSSPISSLSILTVLVVSLILWAATHISSTLADSSLKHFYIALALLATSVVTSVAGIANDNLQDLKAGRLVGATPAKQEWILIFGCIAGALVLAPVLNTLYQAYGFAGLPLGPAMDPNAVLNAPQAHLMADLSQGVFEGTLRWQDLGLGVVLGIVIMGVDKLVYTLSNGRFSFPLLAFAMGIYLPPAINMPLFFGAIIAFIIKKRTVGEARYKIVNKRGILFSSGLIVGESLMGVFLAGAILISAHFGGNGSPFAVKSWSEPTSQWVGFGVFVAVLIYCYHKITTNYRKMRWTMAENRLPNSFNSNNKKIESKQEQMESEEKD